MASLFSQILREARAVDKGESSPAGSPAYYVEPDFFKLADELRRQFEERIAAAREIEEGMTPLVYAFYQGTYQFLTASAERIFSQELLDEFLDGLRTWGSRTLRTSCASTPQVRVYINGCSRDLRRDNTEAGWHWLLSLAGNGNHKVGRIKLIVDGVAADTRRKPLRMDSLVGFQLRFNELLAHHANDAYAIEPAKCSMSPLEGAVFLDGYLW